MNVTAVARQITDYTFRLTGDDLERYLADPQAWAADVRAQLGVRPLAAPADPQPKPKRGGGRRSSKKVGGGRRAASPRSTSGKKTSPPAEALICPVCQKPFKTKGRFNRHIAKMHPGQTPE